MRSAALGIVLAAALLAPATAAAMIAVDLFRAPLRAAAEEAARCPDIRDGRYVVRLRIDGEGRGFEVDLRQAPEGIGPATEWCIEEAFVQQRYPSAGGHPPAGPIMISFPFVVSGHGDGGS